MYHVIGGDFKMKKRFATMMLAMLCVFSMLLTIIPFGAVLAEAESSAGILLAHDGFDEHPPGTFIAQGTNHTAPMFAQMGTGFSGTGFNHYYTPRLETTPPMIFPGLESTLGFITGTSRVEWGRIARPGFGKNFDLNVFDDFRHENNYIGRPGTTLWVSAVMNPNGTQHHLISLGIDNAGIQPLIAFGVFGELWEYEQGGVGNIILGTSSNGQWGLHVGRFYDDASIMNDEPLPTRNAGGVFPTVAQFPNQWVPNFLNPVTNSALAAPNGEPALVVIKIEFGENPVNHTRGVDYWFGLRGNAGQLADLAAFQAGTAENYADRLAAATVTPTTVSMFINPDIASGQEPTNPDIVVSTILDVAFNSYSPFAPNGRGIGNFRVGTSFCAVAPAGGVVVPPLTIQIPRYGVTRGENGSVTVTTNRALDVDEVLIAALFDEDGWFLGANTSRREVSPHVYAIDIAIPENVDRVRVFAWDGLNTMNPIAGVADWPPPTVIEELLAERNLPDAFANGWNMDIRQEVIDLLTENMFGPIAPAPTHIEVVELFGEEARAINPAHENERPLLEATREWFFSDNGVAEYRRFRIVAHLSPDDYRGLGILGLPPEEHKFEFEVNAYIPLIAREQPVPAVVLIDFRGAFEPGFSSMRQSVERGVAVFSFNYRTISNDFYSHSNAWHAQFDNVGLDRLYFGQNFRDFHGRTTADPSQIGFWGWGASRVVDLLETLDFIDMDKVAVSGFSRTGKAALWVGAVDERFTYVAPSASGAGGVSLARPDPRGGSGETFVSALGWSSWFSVNAQQYRNPPHNGIPSDFDMHFAVAAIAPRRVFATTSWGDQFSAPRDDFMSLVAASPAWEYLGYTGFIHPDRLPEAGDNFSEGNLGLNIRGVPCPTNGNWHMLSPLDWAAFLDFFNPTEPKPEMVLVSAGLSNEHYFASSSNNTTNQAPFNPFQNPAFVAAASDIWMSANDGVITSANPQWLAVDLGEEKEIVHWHMVFNNWESTRPPRDYELQYWDGPINSSAVGLAALDGDYWTTVVDPRAVRHNQPLGSGNNVGVAYDTNINPTTARFFRVLFTGNQDGGDNNVRVLAFRLYAFETSAE